MEVRLTEQDAVCRMDRGADDGKVGKPDIRQARCGCVGVQDAGGRSFGVPGSGGLFRITGAGGKNGGKVRVRFRGQWFVRGMLWKRNRSISFHFVC